MLPTRSDSPKPTLHRGHTLTHPECPHDAPGTGHRNRFIAAVDDAALQPDAGLLTFTDGRGKLRSERILKSEQTVHCEFSFVLVTC